MGAFAFLLDPRVWVAMAVAAAISAAVAYPTGRADGHELERAGWLDKENVELAAANAEIERLNDEAREKEHQHAADLAEIGEKHEKDLEAGEAQRRADVAAARSGALKLRVGGACPARPGASGAGEAAPAAGERDGATTAELPPAVTADLLELVDDADAVVRQLTSCQAVVKSFYPTNSKGEP